MRQYYSALNTETGGPPDNVYGSSSARDKTKTGASSNALYTFLWVAVVFVAALFYFGEYRMFYTRMTLLPMKRSYTPVSCEPLKSNDGILVHIDCPIRNAHTFYPPVEFTWNLGPFTGLFFEMKVEMFQWVLEPKALGLSYSSRWTPNLVDSNHHPLVPFSSRSNPDFFPNINGAGRRFAPHAYAGGFRLSRRHLVNFHKKQQLALRNDGYYSRPSERPPTTVSYANTQVYNNALYTGDPLRPQIGDLRITFWGSTATHISAIAKQEREFRPIMGVALAPYTEPPYFSSNRTVKELVLEGDYSPSEMFSAYLELRDGSCWTFCIIRFVLLLLLTALIGFRCQRLQEETSRHSKATAQKTALWPLIFGSGCFALSTLMLTVSPLRLLSYDFWAFSGFLIGGLLFVALGVLTWRYGEESDVSLERQHPDLEMPKTTLLPSNNERHDVVFDTHTEHRDRTHPRYHTSPKRAYGNERELDTRDGGGGQRSSSPQHHEKRSKSPEHQGSSEHFYQPV